MLAQHQGCSMFVMRCKADTPAPVTTREGRLSTQYSVRSRCNKLLTSTNCSTSISITFISTLQFLSLNLRNIYYIVNCPCSKFYGVTFYIIYFIILWRYLLHYLYCYFDGSPFTLFISTLYFMGLPFISFAFFKESPFPIFILFLLFARCHPVCLPKAV